MADRNTIKSILKGQIGDATLVIVSNREPYIHRWSEGEVVVDKPASGLVTAIDPVLQACDGLWVAHGSGNADREAVDANGCVRVPPGRESYTLKRVWLTKDEERGYYLGTSNGMLWPMCHIAFTVPTFDTRDWEMYRRVNQRFADAILDSIGDQKAFVWVQDYHFVLLPKMLKQKRSDITVAQFWHIPWPNPEIFRICPWGKEILEGMLGNDLIGFHIRMHCDNFLNTVDQTLEVRIDRERSTIFHHGGVGTKVKPFPISVDFEMINRDVDQDFTSSKIAKDIKERLPRRYECLGVGIDRIDYTKGITQRFRAIDRLFSKYPDLTEKFVFLQMGYVSRIHIALYKDLNEELYHLVEEINWKYATDNWQPIVFMRRNMTYPEVLYPYKIADLCVVSSLHDGMNLVAKEFVSCRKDEDGVLLLSKFTGAARELEENALIVNPFDTEQFADAIYKAITMKEEEKRARMKAMREAVKQNDIYNWGANFISELMKMA